MKKKSQTRKLSTKEQQHINSLKESLLKCTNHTGKIMIAQSIIRSGGTQEDINEVEVRRASKSITKEKESTVKLFVRLYPKFKVKDKVLITIDVFNEDFDKFFIENYRRQLLFDKAPSDMCRLFYFLCTKWNEVRISNGLYSLESFMTPEMDKWCAYCHIREYVLKQLTHTDFHFIANMVDY